MEGIFIGIGSILFIIIGIFRILRERVINTNKREFAINYNNTVIEYSNNGFQDHEKYIWLQKNAPKLQNEMEGWGIASQMQLPFRNYLINNFQIIINGMELINSNNRNSLPDQSIHYVDMIQNSILRYVGDLEEDFAKYKNRLFNPLILWNKGISTIFYAPILLISYLLSGGLKIYNLFEKGILGLIMKLINFIIIFITIVSSIMTIILGWDGFVEIIKKLIN